MFTKLLSRYLSMPPTDIRQEIMFDTKSGYEFEMAALLANGRWYVVVEHPDSSRLYDIDKVIQDEFNAQTKGWCVLSEYQAELGAGIIDFSKGDQEYNAITYNDGHDFGWLLRIKPKAGSRLLGESPQGPEAQRHTPPPDAH